jgi:putative hydrolase of the HAD superfamily
MIATGGAHARLSGGQRPMRIPCRAVFLDAGGVIVLPHQRLVAQALAGVGIDVDASSVSGAHYRAVRRLDHDPLIRGSTDAYLRAFCDALGVSQRRSSVAVHALSQLADRDRSGEILWSEATPHALRMIAALQRAAIKVLVVTNSDGHAAENLRDAGICQTTPGAGVTVSDVIDSTVVGSAKPDAGIFHAALRRAQAKPTSVVHVGDMLHADIDGARAAGIVPIHLDPDRACRSRDHRHIRSLAGIWRHVAPPSVPAMRAGG